MVAGRSKLAFNSILSILIFFKAIFVNSFLVCFGVCSCGIQIVASGKPLGLEFQCLSCTQGRQVKQKGGNSRRVLFV